MTRAGERDLGGGNRRQAGKDRPAVQTMFSLGMFEFLQARRLPLLGPDFRGASSFWSHLHAASREGRCGM